MLTIFQPSTFPLNFFLLFVFSCCSYMVDAADPEKIEASKNELHNLLDKPQLQGIPVRTTNPTDPSRAELSHWARLTQTQSW